MTITQTERGPGRGQQLLENVLGIVLVSEDANRLLIRA